MRTGMQAALAIASVCVAMLCAQRPGQAQDARDPTRLAFDAPRSAVVMAGDIANTDWPARLASPSDEGQFEVLVRKNAAPVQAPHCNSQYLVVRMPASVSIGNDPATQAAVARKRQVYDRMLDAYTKGQSIHFDVFAGPYGKRLPNGEVALTGCNLFFQEPAAPHR
jgi:hypothetical protein